LGRNLPRKVSACIHVFGNSFLLAYILIKNLRIDYLTDSW